jgi:uncharacterized protein (DUF885 family)
MKTPGKWLASILFFVSSASFADATSDFTLLLDEHWEWRMASSPVMASMLGDRRYNDQWPDNSLAAIEQRHNETRDLMHCQQMTSSTTSCSDGSCRMMSTSIRSIAT